MKNWQEAELGSELRAMETMPRTWLAFSGGLNSALSWRGPFPMPQLLVLGVLVLGSPPWIMNPGMTR